MTMDRSHDAQCDAAPSLFEYCNSLTVHPIVPYDRETDRLLVGDFTDNNKELTDEVLYDTIRFCNYMSELRQRAGVRYIIGGWGEHRTIYKRSQVFEGREKGALRRLHLGLDVWAEAGVPVYAPLDGEVHSFAYNGALGDYGATIILRHTHPSRTFYTLYGHLDLASLSALRTDMPVCGGQQIASFGLPAENGHWPPHLHLQLVEDIGTWWGDYPGVCAYEEQDVWLRNSPNPDALLRMMADATKQK